MAFPRARPVAGATILLVSIVAGAASVRHPGPSVWADLKFDLERGKLLVVVEGAADPLTTNMAFDTLLLGPLDARTTARAREHLVRQFRDGFEVRIDGERALPELGELVIPDGSADEASWKSVRFTLEYPCPAMPRSIAVTWDRFEGEGIEFIPVVVHPPGGVPDMFSLWPDEPEYIWHAADVRPRQKRRLRRLEPRRGSRVSLPLASISFAAGGVVLLFLGRRRALRRIAVPAALGVLAAAGLCLDRGRVEVEVPWKTRVPLPSPDQAREIFRTLHENIYAAFDQNSEDAIYDLLATSVDAAILDDLYGDVYESLILREQGGAICEIEKVEVIDGSVKPASYTDNDEAVFSVDWHWTVLGMVSHWGHIHRRMNEYQAEYRVRHDGESWKIAGVDVKKHERVEEFE